MSNPSLSVDITDPAALVRAAEEVERTRQPRIVTRGERQIAVLSPIRQPNRPVGRALDGRDSLFRVVGQAHVEDADDVVDNVDAYLAPADDTE
jgi:hypothetical protein